MSGEILADGDSPMMMTVDQYNERVARTWNLAIAAEQERIIKLLEETSLEFEQYDFNAVGVTNGLIALIKGEK